MVHGVTFDAQLVSSKDLAHYMYVFSGRKSGVTKGCTMTRTSTKITVNAGYFLCYGRFVEINGYEQIGIPIVSSGTEYCRLVFEIDLSKSNTEERFLQGEFKILESYSAYPELIQENLDEDPSDGVYQFPFAKFTLSSSGLANWVDERPTFTSTAIITVPKTGWSNTAPYTQTIQSSDIVGTLCPGYDIYNPTTEAQIEAFGCLNKLETGQGYVTLTCVVDKPEETFQIQIKE